eukprot:15472373-Alexandrium_andersonii.AAC.1
MLALPLRMVSRSSFWSVVVIAPDMVRSVAVVTSHSCAKRNRSLRRALRLAYCSAQPLGS